MSNSSKNLKPWNRNKKVSLYICPNALNWKAIQNHMTMCIREKTKCMLSIQDEKGYGIMHLK